MAKVTIKRTCVCCGNIVPIKVEERDWKLFNTPNRPCVQDCFPYLTPDEREMFISGVCKVCWDDMFGEDEEDEEYEPTAEDLKEWQDASCGRC